jgi:acyl-CoA thioesterase-2
VRAHQSGRVIAQAVVSLHTPESSTLAHQTLRPPSTRLEEATTIDLGMIPWETRAVGGVDLESREVGPAESAFYMRTPALDRDAGGAHRALLAHATDLTAIGTALRPHEGLSEADSPDRIQTAVTTHTIWFHADDLRVDDWWLLVQSSPVLAGARGHGRGDVFDASGRLWASLTQESLIRPVP